MATKTGRLEIAPPHGDWRTIVLPRHLRFTESRRNEEEDGATGKSPLLTKLSTAAVIAYSEGISASRGIMGSVVKIPLVESNSTATPVNFCVIPGATQRTDPVKFDVS